MKENDPSNGYEAIARDFIDHRNGSSVGAAHVAAWARELPSAANVLDIGCGSGVPISETLINAGLSVYGIDASAAMINAFQERFPGAGAACEPAGESRFFGRQFDGVVCWGLMFLLKPEEQSELIGKVARALKPAGRFLFTAPEQECIWKDAMTGKASVSLGFAAYEAELNKSGFSLVKTYTDEGDNYYYDAVRKLNS